MKKRPLILILLLTLIGNSLFAQNPVLVENAKLTITNLGGDNYTVGSNAELRISTPITGNGTINLTSDSGWVILEGVLPSRAILLHLSYMKVNGQPAKNNVNVRVTNYLRGSVIIPHSPTFEALSLFKDGGYTGDEMKCIPYKFYKSVELGSFDNQVSSFKLKKGYMATFAQNQDGTGYSKVFIADKDDIEISTLQTGLNKEVSFVRVFPWRYTEKKGMGWGIKSPIQTLRGSWFYNWGALTTEGIVDIEFVPMKWSAKSNSDSQWKQIVDLNSATHLLGFNEPTFVEQANMSVEQQLIFWPKMMESGLRLGSPAAAGNINYLYKFIEECDKRNYRVDFIAIHDYREGTAKQYYDYCKAIYDKTKRPIWITEYNYGATWTASRPTYEQMATRMTEIMEKYNTEGIIERYAIFNFTDTTQNRAVFYNPVEDLKITPLGVAYRDKTAPMAFNPAEQINIPYVLTAPRNLKGICADGINTKLTWENYSNTDSGTITIERSYNGSAFTEVGVVPRSSSSFTENISAIGFGKYTYRLITKVPNLANLETVSVIVDVMQDGMENVARYKDVIVSSTNSGALSAANLAEAAVDGDIISEASRWVSRSGSFPATFEINLRDFYLVNELVLYTGSQTYGNPLTDFKFQYWSNNQWVDAISETANTLSSYRKSFTEVKTNKLRLYVNSADGNIVRLFEIEVYGKLFNSLSTNEFDFNKNEFKIYPNPTSNLLYVEGESDVESVVIFDLNARKLIKKEDSNAVDVSELSSGTYIVKVNNKETFRLIKK